ncbi:MFS family permease [Arthrobacter sp. CAN_A214]|uniref:MFS transporter n=1 Tax=Arthrobacter sp. CAN_A214 TaxID=2787720 RepID=UPI0018C9A1BE
MTATGPVAGVGPKSWRRPALAMFTVGYGANQFVPLLAVYRRTLGLSDAEATAVFVVYAVGLIPGLLVGGRISDRQGRRRLMLAFAALSLVATMVLISGQWGVSGLYAGRFLTGVVSGAIFSIGTAWIKELSETAAEGAGARRAALALTAGLGIGPLIAGLLAQWAPAPQVLPYLVHLVIAAVALVLLFRAPETRFPGPAPARPPQLLPAAAATPAFRLIIVPMAPWVFGSVTLVFTTLGEHAVPRDNSLAVAFSGLLAAFALAAGALIQPTGRRLSSATRSPGGAAAVGLAVVATGCLAAAGATAWPSLWSAAAAALLLGAGYGLCLIVGLAEVEELASREELGGVVALYYSLAYAGLAIPYLLALAAPSIGYPVALLATACAAMLTLIAVAAGSRRLGSAR